MTINGADTVFVIIATILVFLMTPALALFYGGLVRRKNVLSTTMHSYGAIVLVSLQWIILGYTLVFGTDNSGIIGGLNFLGLDGVGFEANADYAATIPHQAFMLFQMMFAVITPALISGAFAERMKFSAMMLFTLLWTTFVYDPIAHWVWGVGGWLRTLGALDFAGGNVVHISSGISALVVALILGKRKYVKHAKPHNVTITVLGAGLLWVGWFGFNAGSALAINDVALNAFITTNTAAAACAAVWMILERIRFGKSSAVGLATGAVAGLVAITPGAGFVTPMAAIIIGAVAAIICFIAIYYVKEKLGYDDALDAFGCHGIGGIWGAIATGLFATTKVNSAGADGLFYGGAKLLGAQFIAVIATIAFAGIVTFIIVKIVDKTIGLRVSTEVEDIGLDTMLHGNEAYETGV
ncbi:ammonium transporter [Clostridium cellulovorans]|uniref:Ammonium transporter n=1 Tax=Clostridium cellulovorans (strain ATCC 35296 / DSM 3052 / OCM 3 / 743B) TaxID=573061 RepID=D9SSB2_CLOC7|nr:ammonium transporter [Clostridium cellulovorans]ADL52559.1 ammonium transporter [Clostridium cellulovorans 743B]